MMVFRCPRIEFVIVAGVLALVAGAGCGTGPKIPTASVSGTVTINGKPVENVELALHPIEKIRPAHGITDATGHYSAQFLRGQSGVPLGACVVKITYRPNGGFENILPAQYNDKAAGNPALKLTVPTEGTTFNFDVKMDRPLPERVAGP
jgi:hypothetical protein